MIIQTKDPYSGKGKIWLKFVIGEEEFERFFKVTFQGIQKGKFFYEVEDGFPKEMVKLIFGLDAVIVR
ncbi:hypothetical protein [Phorcysia thermohydrogeniphila]|uniref:Uncharacterized protein n=1 Tax=Phorcysia thermohydrogeniphila TaxID=936138 RepID=A0A4R1G4B6_9BACT|nr:hypothetical protein [Phorcysia thermohydrogeniphila]TCK02484.1 hypothetical protein CLV27_1659 [Phorcysia thermohydrogeniphila]